MNPPVPETTATEVDLLDQEVPDISGRPENIDWTGEDLIGTHQDPVGLPNRDQFNPNKVLVPLNINLSEF